MLLGALSIIGIISAQVFWVQKAYAFEEREFNQSVKEALTVVSHQLAEFNGHEPNRENPVKQLGADYFIVNVQDFIDESVLEYYLSKELDYQHIQIEYEYAIYDCQSDQMIACKPEGSTELKEEIATVDMPKTKEYMYYFGIRFPTKNQYLRASLGPWTFTTLLVFIATIFFSYSIFIILRQKRLSEIQRDFINNMTHEFKTPISTIAISSRVLSEEEIKDEPERLKSYANIISDEAQRLNTQVEKVLQVAKSEKEELSLKKEWLDVHEVLETAVNKLNLKSYGTDAKITSDLQAERRFIEADRTHFINVIWNLLDNAVKYSKETAEICVRTTDSEKLLQVSIQDTGIGMAPDQLNKIFHKFYRIPTGNVHDVKGFGLGLHYVKNIAAAHKWKLQCDSKEGVGSTFTLFIPHAKSNL